MSKLEAIIVGAVVALVPPAVLLLVAGFSAGGIWWLSGGYLPEKVIGLSALAGLSAGVLLDCFFLKRWTHNVYCLSLWCLVAAYLGSAIVGLFVCMGVPVFHPLLGAVAGLYVGRRLAHARTEGGLAEQAIRHVAAFASIVMLAICALSGTAALLSPSTLSDLQHILQPFFTVPFIVSRPMVIGLILGGGAVLVLLQYWLARKAAALAYGKLIVPHP
jgi:hypothetical protein